MKTKKSKAQKTARKIQKKEYQPHHLKANTLVLIGGVIPGVIIGRVSRHMYEVLSQGKIHHVHRDVIIEGDDTE